MAVLDVKAVNLIYKHQIDLVVAHLTSLAALVTTLIGSIMPIYKKQEFISLYQKAIELGDLILPLKKDPFMDKKFVYKVAFRVSNDILYFVVLSFIIVFAGVNFANIFLILFRIFLVFPQCLLLMFPLNLALICFTFAAHLIKIISLKVRKIVEKIKVLHEEKMENVSNARFMMDCCTLSDDLEFLSESYCKVIAFASHVMKTLQVYLLFFCLTIFLMIIKHATSIYSGVFGDSTEAGTTQIIMFCLTSIFVHFLVYGPQKIIKRSKKLQEIVNSLLLEETETRLDKSVRK